MKRDFVLPKCTVDASNFGKNTLKNDKVLKNSSSLKTERNARFRDMKFGFNAEIA